MQQEHITGVAAIAHHFGKRCLMLMYFTEQVLERKKNDAINWRSLPMQVQKIRLFDTLLSALSKMAKTPLNYWAEFAVDIPLGVVLLVAGLRRNELDPLVVFFFILLGLFLFSIIEYSFHRWLFHGSVQIIAQGHRAHHENPLGYDSLPFFLPAVILLALTGVFVLVMPANLAFLLTGTITISYAAYGLSHFTIHHHRFHYARARNWAAHHLVHHYHSDTNFGVTTPLWDRVLGTRYIYNH
jgi:sterol desaturase/sphingolipid hydroxylase (fatty acid hydroxylase superfamily)